MGSRVKGDIFHGDPLDHLVFAIVLSHAAYCNAQAIIEVAVTDTDTRAVTLECYAVVSIVYCPIVEADMRGSNRVGSVGVRFTCG